jgi:hypothetical protein
LSLANLSPVMKARSSPDTHHSSLGKRINAGRTLRISPAMDVLSWLLFVASGWKSNKNWVKRSAERQEPITELDI